MIATRTYYRGALLFPLLLPVAVLVRGAFHGSVGPAAVALRHGYPYVIAPYLGLVIVLLGWTRGRTDREVQHTVRLSPFVLVGILMVHYGISVLTPAVRLLPPGGIFWGLVFVGLAGLIFGYLCVGVAEIGYGVLTEAQVVAPPRPDSGA